MTELKPCPFCGGKANIGIARVDGSEKTYSIVCKRCNVGIFSPRFAENEWNAYGNVKDAIKAWNRRAAHGNSD